MIAFRNKKDIKLHILYWILYVAFFSFVWGTYDSQYGRNVMVQIFSLPARLLLVYGTLVFLVPRLFHKEKYFLFLISMLLLLLFCSVFVQRSMMIFFIEGAFLPYNSPIYFKINELTNTTIDVGIASIIPFTYEFFSYWQKSKKELEALSQKSMIKESEDSRFLIIKEGHVNHKVYMGDIIYIESLKNYLKVKTVMEDIISYGSISSFESELPPDQFLRVQRSFIINLKHLQSYTSRYVDVKGTQISIGRKYKEEVLGKLSEFLENQN